MTPKTASKLPRPERKKLSRESENSLTTQNKIATLLSELKDRDYRESYVEAHAKDTVAFQLRQMRLAENWEQKDVAARLGNSKLQPMISRYENPDYGKYSVTTLLELARVFDVALVVRFVKLSELLRWDLHKTAETLQPASYSRDVELSSMRSETWMWRQEARTPVPIPLSVVPVVSLDDVIRRFAEDSMMKSTRTSDEFTQTDSTVKQAKAA
jgi:transcriptional regulator with XRE-family HTH domain